MSSNNNKSLPIGGFIKQSLIDYPGNISSVIFTQGCNFRCVYCHNPDLVWPGLIKKSEKVDTGSLLDWINLNKQLLDAVVITGGEPTMHAGLEHFITQIKELGLKVKLDTNGTNPAVLDKLIAKNLLDYIAMDVKAPLGQEEYSHVINVKIDDLLFQKIKESIALIKDSTIDFEFRTTLLAGYHTEESIEKIAGALSGKLFLQNFRPTGGANDPELKPFGNYDGLGDRIIGATSVIVRKG